jgi:nucleotide-binding universal stress UspA family protein
VRVHERVEPKPRETARLVLANILFATDFSLASEVGLRYALALARHYHGKVHIVPAASMDLAQAIANDARKRALDRLGNQVSGWVAQAERSGQLNGVRYEIHAGESDEEALSRLLENPNFDLAINGVGCHEGQTVLLEPTVEQVIQRSECPVLTMSAQFKGTPDCRINSILYATDFSPESLEASRYAVSLAQEFEARLTLLHVGEELGPALPDERARIAKAYQLWLGKLVPDEARLWCELEFAVEFGRPAERILQVAWENHVDLIVLGARGLDRLTSPGQNVRKVICHAWCPVLTISGALAGHKQERFWRAAAAASESQTQEILQEAS